MSQIKLIKSMHTSNTPLPLPDIRLISDCHYSELTSNNIDLGGKKEPSYSTSIQSPREHALKTDTGRTRNKGSLQFVQDMIYPRTTRRTPFRG